EALDGAVFAERPVERDDRHVDVLLAEDAIDVPIDVDLRDPVAALLERLGHGLAALDRDLLLGAEAPEQNSDVLVLHPFFSIREPSRDLVEQVLGQASFAEITRRRTSPAFAARLL